MAAIFHVLKNMVRVMDHQQKMLTSPGQTHITEVYFYC